MGVMLKPLLYRKFYIIILILYKLSYDIRYVKF